MRPPEPVGPQPASGYVLALAAYVIWGLSALYMKALAHVPAAEVVAHRVLWSLPIAAAMLMATGRTADLFAALRSPKALRMSALAAAAVAANWGIYVWAIGAGRGVEAALGFYMNPLCSILLGMAVFGERLLPSQMLAVGLAVSAVVLMTVASGAVPYVPMGLLISWGAYSYLKKSISIGPTQGFMLEILMLAVPAAGYCAWLAVTGQGHFLAGSPSDNWLLVGCGVVTAVPLIMYGLAVRRLRLSAIGILQYVTPTLIFLIAVLVFDEPFPIHARIAFAMIWVAVAIFTWPMLRRGGVPPQRST